MTELGVVEDTLFVPMLGRIYTSEHFPEILYDEHALFLKNKLPPDMVKKDTQTQYTLIASAVRSANIDRSIAAFLKRKPNGVIVQLGCGLETTYYRNDNGQTWWYAIDLPHVINYRTQLIDEPIRETPLAQDAFSLKWLEYIRSEKPTAPLLITAGGFFYYFEKEKIIELFCMLRSAKNIEIVFDAVSKSGLAMMQRKYMKQVGHAEAQMSFFVDSAELLACEVGGTVVCEDKYFCYTNRSGLKFSTRLSMSVCDILSMVKMIHLILG